jgi:hypothetical protein
MLLDHSRHILLSFLSSLYHLRRLCLIVSFAVLLLANSGCSSLNQINSPLTAPPLDLSILKVEPETSGTYTVSGRTTLPDNTQITVAAVRHFETAQTAQTTPNYAILDRQTAQVNQGTWQARLNIWQASANGQFQEAWQANPSSSKLTKPEATVTFLAVLEPLQQSSSVRKQTEALDPSLQATLTGFTTDGELYLQARQSIDVLPPLGKSSTASISAPTKPQIIKPNAATPDTQLVQQPQPRINLPVPPEAFLR